MSVSDFGAIFSAFACLNGWSTTTSMDQLDWAFKALNPRTFPRIYGEA